MQLSDIFNKIFGQPSSVAPQDITNPNLTEVDKKYLEKIGMTVSSLQTKIAQELSVNYDRCLSGDTKVPLLDGRTVSILDLLREYEQGKTNYVYSCSPEGKVGGSKIEKVWATGQKEALRVWLDNGRYIDCSYNHKFLSRDGSVCLAEDLRVGQSLMPFHRRKLKKNRDYEGIWDVQTSKWQSTYKTIYEAFYGVSTKELNKGLHAVRDCDKVQVIHHKDFNKHNNNPDNLKLMTSADHILLHGGNSEFLKAAWARLTPEEKELRLATKVFSQLGINVVDLSIEERLKKFRELQSVELHTCECSIECGQTFWRRKYGIGSDRRYMPGHNSTGRVRPESEKEQIRETTLKLKAINRGKNFEQLYGKEKADLMKEKQSKAKLGKPSLRKLPTEIRDCACGCGQVFECKVKSKQRFIWGHNTIVRYTPSYNHKIVKIEKIGVIGVYDVSVTGEHTFGLDVGIFIHNCNLYLETINSLSHPLMSAAVDLYANYATAYNRENRASVWITADNTQYRATLEKMLERINIEEKIYDWAYALSYAGDLFARVNGQPGTGIISLEDGRSPIEYFRIENNGQLIGFYHQVYSDSTKDNSKLLPPWSHVHFKVDGSRKRRSTYNDSYGYRTSIIGIGGNSFQESTAYGCPLIMSALPVYKRLRLAEDSVLMARATRGVTKYLYSLGVSGANAEAVSSLIVQYSAILKRARAIDTTPGETSYSDRLNNLNVAEDVLIPIWGDVGQFKIDKLGGEVDIKWLTDVDKLEQQLATALAVPLPLLGGTAGEGGSGFDNGGSLVQMDIRFGRASRRLQRGLIQGITRLCQLHLAYLGMDPDASMFEVHMSESSTAEDELAKKNMQTSVEACDMLMDLMVKFVGEGNIDRKKMFDFLNENVLHLKDLNYEDILKEDTAIAPAGPVAPGGEGEATVADAAPGQPQPLQQKHVIDNRNTGDLSAFTVLNEATWKGLYEKVEVQVELDDYTKKRLNESTRR